MPISVYTVLTTGVWYDFLDFWKEANYSTLGLKVRERKHGPGTKQGCPGPNPNENKRIRTSSPSGPRADSIVRGLRRETEAA